MEDNEKELEEKLEETQRELEEDDDDFVRELREIKNENTKSKIIIIALASALVILLIVLGIILLGGKKDQNNTTNTETNTNTNTNTSTDGDKDKDDKKDEKKRIPRNEYKMRIYRVDGVYIEDSYCDAECSKDKDTIIIDIEDLDARLMSVYPNVKYESNVFPLFIVYKDGNKIKFFDSSQKRSYTTILSAEFDEYEFIVYNNDIKAVFYAKDDRKTTGIYSAVSDKHLYVNQYDSFEPLNDNYIYGIKDGNKTVLSVSEEKTISSSTSEKSKQGDFNIEKETIGGLNIYNIYDKNYNLIIDKKKESNFSVYDNKLYVVKNNRVYQYDSDGKEGYVSNPYQNVVRMARNYFIVTNSGKLMVVETLSNNIVLQEDLNGYKVSEEKSGYLQKSAITTMTGEGVYVVIDDGSNIKEYKYDPVTKKVTKQ